MFLWYGSRDTAVGIASGYGLNDQKVAGFSRSKIFFSTRRPDHFWDPLSLLPSGYCGIFARDKAAGALS
jgi:hypothetical protein